MSKITKKIKYYINCYALRGGASKMTDALIPFELECAEKLPKSGKRIHTMVGASAGGLETGKISNGLIGVKGERVLKRLKYDKVLRDTCNWNFWKVLKLPVTIAKLKTVVSRDMQKVLREVMSWKNTEKVGYVENPIIVVASRTEIAKISGIKWLKSFVDTLRALTDPKVIKKGLKNCGIYYATKEGWYIYRNDLGYMKISDTVSPMSDCVYATFVNDFMKCMKFKIKLNEAGRHIFGKKFLTFKSFDGGIFNNEANLPFFERIFQWIQLSYTKEPNKKKPDCLSDAFYNNWRVELGNFIKLKCKDPKREFLEGFTDEGIEDMYDDRVPTNILR